MTNTYDVGKTHNIKTLTSRDEFLSENCMSSPICEIIDDSEALIQYQKIDDLSPRSPMLEETLSDYTTHKNLQEKREKSDFTIALQKAQPNVSSANKRSE